MNPRRKRRATGVPAVALAFVLVAGACGSDDTADTDIGQEQATEQDSDGAADASDDGSDASAGDESGATGATASIPWTAPDGTNPSTIAVSPGGDQVVVGFSSTEPGAEIVVFDVASGAEAWRASIDDAGAFGLGGLMFTTAGVSFYLTDLDGSQIVTFTDGDTSMVTAPDQCAQFVSGTVDATQNVAYTVVPAGFCRVDLSTGAVVEATVGDLLDGAVALNGSIRYAADGSLVATMADADGAPTAIAVDPATLTAIGPVGELPPRLENVYGDLLVDGPVLASGDRVAGTPDGSTIVLLQPSTIDVVS